MMVFTGVLAQHVRLRAACSYHDCPALSVTLSSPKTDAVVLPEEPGSVVPAVSGPMVGVLVFLRALTSRTWVPPSMRLGKERALWI